MTGHDDFENWPTPIQRHLIRIKARKSSHTLKNRVVTLQQWREYCEETGYDVLEADTDLIDGWLDEMRIEGYADKSILNKAYDLSAVYRYLNDRDAVERNPFDHVELNWLSNKPKLDTHSEIRYLDIDEYETLIDACRDLRDELILRLLWATGVRVSEASDIRIDDIDLEERQIEVRTSKQQRGENKSRTVYYRYDLARVLREWLKGGRRNKYLYAGESDYLLLTKQSPRMPVRRLGEIVREVAARTDLQEVVYTDVEGNPRNRITPHTFRHSYAVHRTKNGMPIVYLQDLLGHSEIDVTRKYLKFRSDDIREAEKKYAP
ncbi:tyrosine-type recombinase/integrase [Natrononativus amylolyticus]|uniref:tyrosine-type recombinase/integrase n=1 Tax=Natrononativus amylolyticus TaxID=2963434 RepID=UPI0020CD16DA|nr:tyrosine-type recombinase/integrase [Natrononativus amylolyticus]